LLEQLLAEDETEPEAAEVGLSPEGVNIATGTLPHTLEFVLATSSVASATSSPFSLRIPVMIYHSVRPHTPGESKYQDLYDVTPELLDQELTYIETHGFHPILMRDVDAYWKGATSSLPEKPVILSFDDGWKNQYEYAFPVLQKHHMKGVFFIFTNPIDHKKPHWMSWDQIVEMDKAGMEIGGHTRTHPILTKLPHTEKDFIYEITQPKQIIEKRLGHAITSFAYPFGAKNEAVEVAVARAGYDIARTTVSGVWNDPEHRLEFHGTLSSDKMSQFEYLLHKQ
jgi:peptidoglycan/xylan/chitin deacetylase (PgdA/CDA1 family)